ncbi:MAG: hypothetical protein NTX25_18360, partial [Proteobacteria bacterium]|nr:hypothetical protein [Pseudomonadota bacterium]
MRKEQKAHLLIVDPDQKHRNDWTLELSKAGFLVSSALNLDDAKALLDAHVFDAIAYSQEFESPSFAAAKQSLESDWPQLVIFGSRDTPEDIKGQLATSMEDDKKPIEAEIPAND